MPQALTTLTIEAAMRDSATAFSVRNETTLEAVRRLGQSDEQVLRPSVLCLNFASARNPGGGFLSGAQAQEESLARASGLYACQQAVPEFYEFHRANRDLRYSHRLIYSPSVPVFRDDDDELLSKPYAASIVTMAAPNAGAVRTQQPELTDTVNAIFMERASLLLRFCSSRNYQQLILGAWGCGVFGNDASTVAAMFRTLLFAEYKGAFNSVVFAVFDQSKSEPTYRAFAEAFS